MAAHDRLSILARKSKAQRELARLCKGPQRGGEFRMSIPVDEDYDTDLIIHAALDDIQILLNENAMLLARIAKLESAVTS